MTSFKKVDGDISQVAGYVEEVYEDPRADLATQRLGGRISSTSALGDSTFSSELGCLCCAYSVHKFSNPFTNTESGVVKKDNGKHGQPKRPRVPPPVPLTASNGHGLSGPRGDVCSNNKMPEKKGGFMEALKRRGTFFAKEDSDYRTTHARKMKEKNTTSKPTITDPVPPSRLRFPVGHPRLFLDGECRTWRDRRMTSRPGSKDGVDEPYTRSSSRASYISIHERRRDSMISHTESYSITPPTKLDLTPRLCWFEPT